MLLEFKNSEKCMFYNTDTKSLTQFLKSGAFRLDDNVDMKYKDKNYEFSKKGLSVIAAAKSSEKVPNLQLYHTESGSLYIVNLDENTINGTWFRNHDYHDVKFLNIDNSNYELNIDILINGKTTKFKTSNIVEIEYPIKTEYLNAMSGLPIKFPAPEKKIENTHSKLSIFKTMNSTYMFNPETKTITGGVADRFPAPVIVDKIDTMDGILKINAHDCKGKDVSFVTSKLVGPYNIYSTDGPYNEIRKLGFHQTPQYMDMSR